MVVGVVAATKLHDLVDRNLLEVVGLRSAGEHRFVADVGKRFQVAGCRQPHAPIHAFVEEMPDAMFEPDCRCATRAVGDGETGGEPDVERSAFLPVRAIDRCQQVGNVLLAFGKHSIAPALLHHAHVLDPRILQQRIAVDTIPVEAVGTGRIAEPSHRHLRAAQIGIRAGVPEVPAATFPHDPTALAQVAVPGRRSATGEERIAGGGAELHQFVGEERLAGPCTTGQTPARQPEGRRHHTEISLPAHECTLPRRQANDQ